MGKRYLQVLSVGLAVLVGLGVLEAVFRLRDHNAFPHLNIYEPDKELGVRLRPLAQTRVVFGGSAVTRIATNSAGFRSSEATLEPPPREGEVLFVGDSQTFALGVEVEHAFVSRFGELAKRPVYNAGVPTWGPPEYAAAIDEVGKRRHPRTVVYVVNFANDAFEANHPNPERHVAWDGWAVRREYAPQHVRQFPGRELLFRSSHLVLAWRKLWHSFGGNKLDERGTPSEGTFRDLLDLGHNEAQLVTAAQLETERRAAQYEAETTFAEEAYRNAESRVKALVWSALKLGTAAGGDPNQSPGTVYLAADANPGDIVTPGYGEEGRPIYATAQYVRQAVVLRHKFEQELRERAKRAIDTDEAKQLLSALSARDAERLTVDIVRSKPLEMVRHASPLFRAVLDAKRRAEAIGAEFVLLVLPLDVMVSDTEWPKHGVKKVDLSAASVLISDLVESARAAGIPALDTTDVLRQNEPGVFLPGDIHLTPKGHSVVAKALVQALERPDASQRRTSVPLVLDAGRSRVPPPETWRARAGEIAVMNSGRCPVTKKYREWLYINCYPNSDKHPRGVALQVIAGGQGDAITTVLDGHMTLVAPMVRGERIEALFTWSDGLTKRLIVEWDAQEVAADLHMDPEKTLKATPSAHPEVVENLCACHKSERKATDCRELIAQEDADCTRTYPDKCALLLACAEGNPLYPPRCEAGSYNKGATSRCVKGTPPVSPAPAYPSTSFVVADRVEVQDAGQKIITAAQAFVGDRCTLGSDQVELVSIIPFDRCPIDEAMAAAYGNALGEFGRLENGVELTGNGKTFAEKARWFGKWVGVALASHDTRGAAALYQNLALAFNAWQPERAVFVDSPRMLNLYFGVSGVPKIDYFRNLRSDGAKRRAEFVASGKHLIWRRGPNGFEGPFLSIDERIIGGY
jgi:hypothetical protein